MKAKDDKCCVCGKRAVAYYPHIDPDIPSHPYCAEHLEKAMIGMAKTVFKDNVEMMMVAMFHAKEVVKKYKQ